MEEEQFVIIHYILVSHGYTVHDVQIVRIRRRGAKVGEGRLEIHELDEDVKDELELGRCEAE